MTPKRAYSLLSVSRFAEGSPFFVSLPRPAALSLSLSLSRSLSLSLALSLSLSFVPDAARASGQVSHSNVNQCHLAMVPGTSRRPYDRRFSANGEHPSRKIQATCLSPRDALLKPAIVLPAKLEESLYARDYPCPWLNPWICVSVVVEAGSACPLKQHSAAPGHDVRRFVIIVAAERRECLSS